MDIKCSKCGKVAVKMVAGSLVDKGATIKAVCGECNRNATDYLGGFKEFHDLFGSFKK